MLDVDQYGLPLDAFGEGVWPQFFEVLGRIVAVNGKIEYLKDRLAHLPKSETDGVRKVQQFLNRLAVRADRNAIVHSWWAFGVRTDGADKVTGVRYKIGKKDIDGLPTVSIGDLAGSERHQIVVEYSLDELRKVLEHDIGTMRIGQDAYTLVMMTWARAQGDISAS